MHERHRPDHCRLGGKYVTLEQLKEAIAISEIKQGVSEQLLTAAIQSAKEAAPGSQLKLVIANGQPAVNGQDTRYERLVETPAERILKPQELGHGKVDLRISAPSSPSRQALR